MIIRVPQIYLDQARDEKNNSKACNIQLEERYNSEPEGTNTNRNNTTEASVVSANSKHNNQQQQGSCDNNKIDFSDITEKNNAGARGSNDFQRVTPSQCHTPGQSALRPVPTDLEAITLQEILSIIKAANGLQVAVNTCIVSVHSSNEQVRTYLGDNLTSRDNRKVRDLCLKIIRDHNIEVIKHKPQLVVRWVEANSFVQNKTTDGGDNSTNRGDLP
jgi:hypothetical protein